MFVVSSADANIKINLTGLYHCDCGTICSCNHFVDVTETRHYSMHSTYQVVRSAKTICIILRTYHLPIWYASLQKTAPHNAGAHKGQVVLPFT